jgi:hypothetical protein
MDASIASIPSLSFALTEEAIAERIFAPWSLTLDVGPKHPPHGMFPVMH